MQLWITKCLQRMSVFFPLLPMFFLPEVFHCLALHGIKEGMASMQFWDAIVFVASVQPLVYKRLQNVRQEPL